MVFWLVNVHSFRYTRAQIDAPGRLEAHYARNNTESSNYHEWHNTSPIATRRRIKVVDGCLNKSVQDDRSPFGLEEVDQRVLPATSPERAEADVTQTDRHQRGVQPPGQRLRGHDTHARGRGHPRQPGDAHHDRGYRDAQRGIPPNPGAERHRLTTLTGRHPHGIDPGNGAYLGAQDAREVLLEMIEDKGVENTLLKVDRLCALLDPRWKALGAD